MDLKLAWWMDRFDMVASNLGFPSCEESDLGWARAAG